MNDIMNISISYEYLTAARSRPSADYLFFKQSNLSLPTSES